MCHGSVYCASLRQYITSLKFTRQMRHHSSSLSVNRQLGIAHCEVALPVRYSSSQSVKLFNSIFNFLHRLSPPSSSPTNTRSQVTSRSTSEVGMLGLHDHTGSNNHSCVFTHPCPSSYGHGFSNIASLAPSYRAAQRFTHLMCCFRAN